LEVLGLHQGIYLPWTVPGATLQASRNGLKNLKNLDSLEKRGVEEPSSWEIWQNLTTGIFYYCFECLNACPVGKRR